MSGYQSAPEDRTLAEGAAASTGQGGSARAELRTLTEPGHRPNAAPAQAMTQAVATAYNPSDLPRGATIGRYLVLDRLGAGGMGVVYSAYDPELDRKVAIKLLHAAPGSAGASHGKTRLLREAQAMARLAHPNVISVFDVGTAFDQVFVAMEFIDGGTLGGWLKQQPRTQEEILNLFTLAGRGLAAAHAADLVHRDFKPDNVLVGKDGSVRVTDFGLARNVDPPKEPVAPSSVSAGRGLLGLSRNSDPPKEPVAPSSVSAGRPLRQSSTKARLAALGLPPGLNLLSNQPLGTPLTQSGALMGTARRKYFCRREWLS